MRKFALLVGVGRYESWLSPLPTAVRDAEAMCEVLTSDNIGGFGKDDVILLRNPGTVELGSAIYDLFNARHVSDLLLFYFSGHGIKNERGDLHLSTRQTKSDAQGALNPATSVSARYIQEQMSNSRSKRQVVNSDLAPISIRPIRQ